MGHFLPPAHRCTRRFSFGIVRQEDCQSRDCTTRQVDEEAPSPSNMVSECTANPTCACETNNPGKDSKRAHSGPKTPAIPVTPAIKPL